MVPFGMRDALWPTSSRSELQTIQRSELVRDQLLDGRKHGTGGVVAALILSRGLAPESNAYDSSTSIPRSPIMHARISRNRSLLLA